MILSASNIGWDKSQDVEIYNKMKQCGFSGLEIAPTRIIPTKPYDNLCDIHKFAENIKNEYGFMITSMQSIWFGKTENIFDGHDARKTLIDYTKQAILFAKNCKCNNLVFGSPKNRNMPENATQNDIIEFFIEISDYAIENNTIIALEPNPTIYGTNFINTTMEAIEFVKSINSSGLKINFDLGTVINNNENLIEIFNNIELINHVHISEPYLKPIMKREIHKTLNKILIDKNYKKAVSIEMAKPEIIDIYLDTIEYVSEIFGE